LPVDVGAILGRIVNKEIDPIPGAQVALAGSESDPTTTDADGIFRFTNLVPGKHTIYAAAVGYQSLAQIVEIMAGEEKEVTLALDVISATDPYSSLEIRQGFISCGTGTGIEGSGLAQVSCGDTDPNQRFLFNYTLADHISGVLFEMTWKPTQALSKDLVLIVEKDTCDVSCGANDTFGEMQGCCYLRIPISADELTLPADALGAVDLSHGGAIQTRTFPAFGESTSPMTVFTGQDFEVYVEYFYNGLPGDWESRTNVPE
jgi:hypothetical protein